MRLALVGALALAAAAAAAAFAVRTPSVRFTSLTPVAVRGAQFVPGERVQVTVFAGKAKLVRSPLASAKGGFTVILGSLATKDRCSGSIAIIAVGKRGDRATYKLPQMACPAASNPAMTK